MTSCSFTISRSNPIRGRAGPTHKTVALQGFRSIGVCVTRFVPSDSFYMSTTTPRSERA